MMIEATRPEPQHIEHVAKHLRAIDAEECKRASGAKPLEALERSVRLSPACWAILFDREPVAMFGVAPLSAISKSGRAWMLATDRVTRNPRAVVELSPPLFRNAALGWDRLENTVMEKNLRARRWLRWLGFAEHPMLPGWVRVEWIRV